jgi:hypothetical protein
MGGAMNRNRGSNEPARHPVATRENPDMFRGQSYEKGPHKINDLTDY